MDGFFKLLNLIDFLCTDKVHHFNLIMCVGSNGSHNVFMSDGNTVIFANRCFCSLQNCILGFSICAPTPPPKLCSTHSFLVSLQFVPSVWLCPPTLNLYMSFSINLACLETFNFKLYCLCTLTKKL